MAIISRNKLHLKVAEAIQKCGWNVLYISAFGQLPLDIQIYQGNISQRLKIYIWNLSPGGRKSLPDEYRIQVHVPRFEVPFGGKTLILGWWDEVEVFAGFDFNKHDGPLGNSSSIQVKGEALRKAAISGVSAQDKGNGEVVVAFDPDFFASYVTGLEELHGLGENPQDFQALEEVLNEAEDENYMLNDALLEQVSEERQTAVQTINRKVRDASFKRRVLTAYGYQCAFCGVQLDLIDAAHIIPVSESGSTDQTANGLALCALHHRAFDKALITVNAQYQTLTHQANFARLREIGHDGGMPKFLSDLRPVIHVPPALRDKPHITYITQANKLRGWS